MTYEIKFEIYGKKMKTKIEASSKEMAERILRQKIKIYSVTPIEEKSYKKKDDLGDFFGGAFKDIFKE